MICLKWSPSALFINSNSAVSTLIDAIPAAFIFSSPISLFARIREDTASGIQSSVFPCKQVDEPGGPNRQPSRTWAKQKLIQRSTSVSCVPGLLSGVFERPPLYASIHLCSRLSSKVRQSSKQNQPPGNTVLLVSRKEGKRMGFFRRGEEFALILVLFVLLVIVGCSCD
jgi:uncharacterized protein (TIGR01732 family)